MAMLGRANPLAAHLQLQLQPNPQRSIFVQQLMARALQNNGRGSRSLAESADIASAPIVAALLSKRDQAAQLQQQAQQKQMANQLLGNSLRTNIPLENLDGAPPENFSVPSMSPVDPTRQALAGALAQNPQALTALAMQQASPPQPAMTPYQQASLGLEQRRLQDAEAKPTVPEITPYQRQQLDLEQRRVKLAETQAQAQNNPLGLGQQQPGQQQPSGEDFLKTLPPEIGTQVKALAEGRMAFPAGFQLSKPYWQQMLSAVSQYDPSFDAVNYNARSKTRADFTSGKNSQNIKALNTAIGHLGTLAGQVSGTASHGMTSYNAVSNYLSQAMGDSGPTKFKQTAGALASELTNVFRGTGGAEADVKRYLAELDPNASAEQKQAAIQNIAELLQSRLNAIGDQYNKGMGTTADPLQLLDEKAQKVMGGLGGSQGGQGGGGGSVHWNDL